MVREGVAARERVLFSGFRREDASGIIQARPLEVLHDERGEEVAAREGAVGSSGGGFEAVLLLHSLEDVRAELSLELGEDALALERRRERLCVSRDDETVRGGGGSARGRGRAGVEGRTKGGGVGWRLRGGMRAVDGWTSHRAEGGGSRNRWSRGGWESTERAPGGRATHQLELAQRLGADVHDVRSDGFVPRARGGAASARGVPVLRRARAHSLNRLNVGAPQRPAVPRRDEIFGVCEGLAAPAGPPGALTTARLARGAIAMVNATRDDDEDAPPSVDLYAALGASSAPSPVHHPSPPLVSRWAPRTRRRSRLVAPALARRLARRS